MQNAAWDRHKVMPCFDWNAGYQKSLPFQFRTAAQRYKIIRDEQASVLVPYNAEAADVLARLIPGEPADFSVLRKIQRYVVGVREHWLKILAESMVITQHESGLWLLTNPKAYSSEKGLSFAEEGFDPNILIT